jgi:hypothetical protein
MDGGGRRTKAQGRGPILDRQKQLPKIDNQFPSEANWLHKKPNWLLKKCGEFFAEANSALKL